MHFTKALVLLVGIAAAAPATTSSAKPASSTKAVSSTKAASSTAKPASSTAKPVSSSVKPASSSVKAASSSVKPASSSVKPASSSVKATSSAAASGSAVPTALGTTIYTDLTKWHDTMDDAIDALNSFTGGAKVSDQVTAISKASDSLQAATVQLITDAQKLKPYGLIASADSAKYATLTNDHIAPDLVAIFKLLQDKKSLFNQIGAVSVIRNGLYGFASEVQQIGDLIEPHLQSADVTAIHNAGGANIFNAAQAAIATYA